jgi:hypothetical protein
VSLPRKHPNASPESHEHPPALVKPSAIDYSQPPKVVKQLKSGEVIFDRPFPGDEPLPTRENPIHRRCKNCGKMFWAVRPGHWFHAPSCRKQFHKNNNTGYGKVREIFKKEMRAHLKEFEALRQVVDNLAKRLDALEGFPPHD